MSRISIAFLLLIFAVAVVFFVVMPQWGNISKMRAAIKELRALDEELNELMSNRNTLMQEYNAIPEADLEKITALAPDGRNTASVLVDFEVLTQQSAMFLDQVDFVAGQIAAPSALPRPGAQPYAVVPVTMTLRGTYENFQRFLMALEKNLRLVDVDEITFAASSAKEFPITVKGKLYYRQ